MARSTSFGRRDCHGPRGAALANQDHSHLSCRTKIGPSLASLIRKSIPHFDKRKAIQVPRIRHGRNGLVHVSDVGDTQLYTQRHFIQNPNLVSHEKSNTWTKWKLISHSDEVTRVHSKKKSTRGLSPQRVEGIVLELISENEAHAAVRLR